jgi:hypothetical protein
MFRRALLCALVLSLTVVAPALASPRSDHDSRHRTLTSWADHRGNDRERPTDHVWDRYNSRDDDDSDWSDDGQDDSEGDDSDSGTSDTGTDTTAAETGAQAVMGGTVATGSAQTIQVETTSYNFADNAGSNNATICCPKLHQTAGGDGSFQNPITLAVPGSGGSGMQTPAGTRVYFVKYAFYGLVEDSGASPKSLRRFDIWSDGRGLSTSAGSACMDALTGQSTAILNPPAGKPVAHIGPLGDASGCHVPSSGN